MTDALPIRWCWRTWDALSRDELYAALMLRQRVFVVEQTCPFLEVDGADPRAWHLLGWVLASAGSAPDPGAGRREILGGYVRVFAPGGMYREAAIGRVVTDPHVRRTGLGRRLMAEAIRRVEAQFGAGPIRLGAQLYLERFYGDFGFVRDGAPYDEDGIPHVEMVRGA